MRPDPVNSTRDEGAGNIIYLGDVRRRKHGRSRRDSPDRRYLVMLGLAAGAAWVLWLLVLLTIAPSRLLTYVAFFAPFTVALAATSTLVAYGVEWQRGLFPNLVTCARRGIALALVISVNLGFLAAHRWVLPVGGITVGVALISDIALEHRQRAA